jgi:phosphatidylserine decarboxylase
VRLPVAREGWPFILPPIALAAAAGVAGVAWAAAFFALLSIFLLSFFRDPERAVPADSSAILSPADGTILSVAAAGPEEAPPGLPTKVVIFMSVFNCHVNRAPATGTIVSYAYTPGRKMAAFAPKASIENEQNRIELSGAAGRVVFKQIAGALARRIVFRKKPGDVVAAGERIGMIRFGSRVDLFLPENARIDVVRGARVKAGLSLVGRFAAAP